jgi:hypothetical protein
MLPAQSYRTTHGAVTDNYETIVEWSLAGGNRRHLTKTMLKYHGGYYMYNLFTHIVTILV